MQPGCTKPVSYPKSTLNTKWKSEGHGTDRNHLFQAVQESDPSHRASCRDRRAHARFRQIPGLLPGDDLRRFPSRSKPGWRQPGCPALVSVTTVQAFAWPAATTTLRRITTNGCVIKPQPKSTPVRLNPERYPQLWTEVLLRDGWRCQTCGAGTNLHVHHIQKRSQGGQDTNENLITLCAKCHRFQHGRKTRG